MDSRTFLLKEYLGLKGHLQTLHINKKTKVKGVTSAPLMPHLSIWFFHYCERHKYVKKKNITNDWT